MPSADQRSQAAAKMPSCLPTNRPSGDAEHDRIAQHRPAPGRRERDARVGEGEQRQDQEATQGWSLMLQPIEAAVAGCRRDGTDSAQRRRRPAWRGRRTSARRPRARRRPADRRAGACTPRQLRPTSTSEAAAAASDERPGRQIGGVEERDDERWRRDRRRSPGSAGTPSARAARAGRAGPATASGEGDVGRRRDRPAAARRPIARVEQRDRSPAGTACRRARRRPAAPPAPGGQLAREDLALDLQPDQQEEHRHQAVVDPVRQRLGRELQVQDMATAGPSGELARTRASAVAASNGTALPASLCRNAAQRFMRHHIEGFSCRTASIPLAHRCGRAGARGPDAPADSKTPGSFGPGALQ